MSKISWEEKIVRFIDNVAKIPEDFWIQSEKGNEVVWLMSREDGTAGSYETSQERFGITKEGKVIWGFSSGCSCWDGWNSDDLIDPVTWKEFIMLDTQKREEDNGGEDGAKYRNGWGFVEDWGETVEKSLDEFLLIFKEKLTPFEALSVRNAELRRYLVKRLDYNTLRKDASIKIISSEGEYEIIDVKTGRKDERFTDGREEIDRYIKVKDSSTDRIYLLGIPANITDCKTALAWTFGLRKEQYNPLVET